MSGGDRGWVGFGDDGQGDSGSGPRSLKLGESGIRTAEAITSPGGDHPVDGRSDSDSPWPQTGLTAVSGPPCRARYLLQGLSGAAAPRREADTRDGFG